MKVSPWLSVYRNPDLLRRSSPRGVRRNKRVVLGGVADDVKRHGESALTLGLLILSSCNKVLYPVGQGAGMFSDTEQLAVQLLRDGPEVRLLVTDTIEGKPTDMLAD